MCFSSEPPRALVILITPPREEKGGLNAFWDLFQGEHTSVASFQTMSGFIPERLRKDGKW